MAYNAVQSIDSQTVSYILAAVPSAPSDGPVGDDSVITKTSIKVDFDALIADSETGGSPILSYHLQMDTMDNVFVDIFGQDEQTHVLSTTALVTDPLIEEGTIYGFRYRARNIYGWGDWSPITYILAASVPDTPSSPTFVSASDNSITVSLSFTGDSNGDHYELHELWMAEGDEDIEDDFVIVDSYDVLSQSLQHSVTFATDGIVTGQLYSFKFRAKNSKGYGGFSTVTTIAAIDPPDQPNAPSVDYTLSSESTLFIQWDAVADQPGPGGLITGYSLWMDDGYGGSYSE